MFLDKIDRVAPWAELETLIKPHYAKLGNSHRPVGFAIMLWVYFVQQWFNLSASCVEEALYDSFALRHFVGVDLGVAAAPDETIVCRFRHLPGKRGLGGAIPAVRELHAGKHLPAPQAAGHAQGVARQEP